MSQQLNRSSQATMEKTPEGVCIPSRRVAPSSLIGLKAEVLNPSQFFDKFTSDSFRYPPTLCSALLLLVLSSCALHPTEATRPTYYSLNLPSQSTSQYHANESPQAPTMLVNTMVAEAGFDSQHIMYSKQKHQMAYFAHSEWIDTPAHMITPLIVATLANSGTFRAVSQTSTSSTGDLRLTTELIQLQHDFSLQPSQLRFSMRATIIDNANHQILAWHDFEETVTVTSDLPYDGILASNTAVLAGLQELSLFCGNVTRQWMSNHLSQHSE